MSDRSKLINRLISERDFRADYIRAKLDVLIPSQLRGLRRRDDLTQPQLAEMAGMKQARISAMETQGRVNFNRETLVRMAATYGVGLIVKFVPFSEMLEWENNYSQDSFNPSRLSNDVDFLRPATSTIRRRHGRKRNIRTSSSTRIFQIPVVNATVGTTANLNQVSGSGLQMGLQFESAERPFVQKQLAEVIAMPNRDVSINNLLAAAANTGTGTWRNYGT
jgi:transcriptional regulator with XRE-family HTH domain